MGRHNPYRVAIRRIIRDEQRCRPGCALMPSIGVDEDGNTYIHFTCLSHDATWRYYVHVLVDTELVASPDSGPSVHSRCPVRHANGVASWEETEEAVPEAPTGAEEVADGEIP